jgi:hypothetical protein
MADFDETYPVTEENAAHWHTLRAQRGWSWDTLVDYFERYCGTDPATPGLIAWAKEQGKAEDKPAARAKKRGTERATAKAPESR